MKEKLVVIGNGMSGLRTIEDLLEIDMILRFMGKSLT